MDITIIPSPIYGEVNIPPSKSAAHRALICAALADGESRVSPFCTSKDIKATAACLKALGMKVDEDGEGYILCKIGGKPQPELNFCESGSTARFLLPIASAMGAEILTVGEGRLPERPMKVLCDLIRSHGAYVSADFLPLSLCGKMTSGVFYLPGDISSQYISGILLAAPLMEGETEIKLTTPPQSVGYIDMTIETMKRFGVFVEETEQGWKVPAGQIYKPANLVVEGDWSQAAFFMSAAAIGSDIRIKGLDFGSSQGDMAALDVFAAFGADITIENDILHIKKGNLRGIEVNATNIPDMVPAIAATAAYAAGKTVIHSAERLRIKESDRIKTTIAALNALGIEVEEKPDGMIIYGGKPHGGVIDGANDHRIVMAFSVAAAFAEESSRIIGAEAVEKSYPHFFNDFIKMGGKVK